MNSIFSVAKYITAALGSVTTMKLHKLTYYCQAWHLAWDDEPLFEEEFEAWAIGPVCRDLYERFKGQFRLSAHDFASVPDGDFPRHSIETMDIIISDLKDKAPHWLNELAHMEKPWQDAREGLAPGEPGFAVITKKSMQLYYGGLYVSRDCCGSSVENDEKRNSREGKDSTIF